MLRVCVRDDIVRPVLDFHVGLGQILPDDAQTEELQASDKDDHADGRRPAGDRIAEDQTADNDEDQKQEGETGHQDPEPGSNAERRLGKIDDAVDSILKQGPEAPLGLSRDALHIFKGQPIGLKTDPAEDSLREAVVLAHG